MPNISIITATLNSAATIKDCLNSVSSQSVMSEHLIIDGGSTDETIRIIKSYPHISRFVSEKDRGIYDAMNKGIAMAKGEIIGILNSDDFYVDRHVLKKILNLFENNSTDSCYGDLLYVDSIDTFKIKRVWRSGDFNSNNFYWGWMPPHPTFFVRRSVYEKYGKFNIKFGSAADYELMLRFLVKHKIPTIYLPEFIVKMRTGGISNVSLKNRYHANKMDRLAWSLNGIKPYPWTIHLKPISKVHQFLCTKIDR